MSLRWIKIQKYICSLFWRLTIWYRVGPCALGRLWGGFFLAFWLLWVLLLSSALPAPVCLGCHMVGFLCVCGFVFQCLPFCKTTGCCIRAHSKPLWVYFNSITLAKTLFPNKVTFAGSGSLGLHNLIFFWSTQFNLQHSTAHLDSCIVFLSIILVEIALLLTKAIHSTCALDPIFPSLVNGICTESFSPS